MNISKLIPCKIIIKTLYWTRKENEMIADLNRVCEKIDKEESDARESFEEIKEKWETQAEKAPYWFAKELYSELIRLETMLAFLSLES